MSYFLVLFLALFVPSLSSETPSVPFSSSAQALIKNTAFTIAQTGLKEGSEIAKIMGLCIGATTLYGIVHDQITIRVCKEYFTKGFHETNVQYWPSTGPLGFAKKTLQSTTSSTLSATIWGTVATFSVGLLGGLLLTVASRLGNLPTYTATDLVQPLSIAMFTTGVCSALALQFPVEPRALSPAATQGVPQEKMTAFRRCASAHRTAYHMGALTILGTAIYIAAKRFISPSLEPNIHITGNGISLSSNF